MHRLPLIQTLTHYLSFWSDLVPAGAPHWHQGEETARVKTLLDFVEAHPDCFERSSPTGHITGSALVVSEDLGSVLLTLHRKLGIWVQLGGHSDGDPATDRVALREAEEESGLPGLTLARLGKRVLGSEDSAEDRGMPECPLTLPFDVDHHVIPERPGEPAHVHYDVRFLIIADQNRPTTLSDESSDLRWFALDEATRVTAEPSMLRQFAKLRWIREHRHRLTF